MSGIHLGVFTLLLTLLGCGCREPSGKPLHLIVPAGFRGPIFILEERSARGNPIEEAERFVYTVPADGIVKVPSFDPFHRYHELSAIFGDGRPLPVAHPGIEPVEEGKVYLFPDLSVEGNYGPGWAFIYFVGSRQQFEAFDAGDAYEERFYRNKNRPDRGPLPPGGG